MSKCPEAIISYLANYNILINTLPASVFILILYSIFSVVQTE